MADKKALMGLSIAFVFIAIFIFAGVFEGFDWNGEKTGEPAGGTGDASGNGGNADAGSSLPDWEAGDWWIVKETVDNSPISGIPGDTLTIPIKYTVVSKNTAASPDDGGTSRPPVSEYIVEESNLEDSTVYSHLYYGGTASSRKLYRSLIHQSMRGENLTRWEHYTYEMGDLVLVTPSLAGELSDDRDIRASGVSYQDEFGGEKHLSGHEFGFVSRVMVTDGDDRVTLLQYIDVDLPWPVYEQTEFITYELMDHSGWHPADMSAEEREALFASLAKKAKGAMELSGRV